MGLKHGLDTAQGNTVPGATIEGLLQRHRFTVADYEAMIDAGILTEDDRVELLDGDVVEKMTINPPHAGGVNRLTRLFVQRLGDRAVVQPQNPVVLDDYSMPEPDIALLRPDEDFYATARPQVRDVLLAIEVADTSLARDRIVKLPLYARAGVPEVWIVNVPARRIEVFKGPSDDGYRESRIIDEGTLSPEAFPDLELGIDELLG